MSGCNYHFKRGWWCSDERNHEGPCPLRPYFFAHPIWWLRTYGFIKFR